LYIDPGPLDRVIFRNTFNGGNFAACHPAYLKLAGSHRLPVYVYRTSATQSDATAKLGATQLEIFPNHPQQGNIPIQLYGVGLAINFQSY
jgi:hypothetical protein